MGAEGRARGTIECNHRQQASRVTRVVRSDERCKAGRKAWPSKVRVGIVSQTLTRVLIQVSTIDRCMIIHFIPFEAGARCRVHRVSWYLGTDTLGISYSGHGKHLHTFLHVRPLRGLHNNVAGFVEDPFAASMSMSDGLSLSPRRLGFGTNGINNWVMRYVIIF